MPAISLNIITKNQVDGTIQAVQSAVDALLRQGDEIVIVDTGSHPRNLKKLKKRIDGARWSEQMKLKIIERPDLSVDYKPLIAKWLPERIGQIETDGQYKDCRGLRSFAEARQVALEASSNEVIFWLDTDDVLQDDSMGGLRQVVDDNMDPAGPKVDAIFLNYFYAHDSDGTVTMVLKRERFFWRDRYHWVGRCHETAIPRPGADTSLPMGFWENLPARISHTELRKRGSISDIRNYVILRSEIEEHEGSADVDPRTLFYLGNAARGLDRLNEAVDLYRRFDAVSGSPNDRFSACYYIAGINMIPERKRPLDASDWFQKCIEILPQDPRGYFGLSRCYAGLRRWQECIHWYQIGLGLPEPAQALMAYDPNHIKFNPHLIAVQAYRELNLPEPALRAAQAAYKARPDNRFAQELLQSTQVWAAHFALTEAVVKVTQAAPNEQEARLLAQDITSRLAVVPEQLEKLGVGRLEIAPATDKPKVAIVCGRTGEPIGPDADKVGSGGSEKMVWLLARGLAKRGFHVSVYASVLHRNRGVDDCGVEWYNFTAFDRKLPRDCVIYWRGHDLIHQFSCPARKRILWFHDVQGPDAFRDKSLVVSIDHFNFQSKYHAEPVKHLLGNKVWIARNATEAARFTDLTKEPYTVAFGSSPDRGLLTVLLAAKHLQQRGTPVKVEVAYGFTDFFRKATAVHSHRHIPDLGRDGSVDDYERAITRAIDACGAVMHERVGYQEYADLLCRSKVLVYPTRFPEISCMTAMDAQAAGAVVVSNRYGALDETIHPELYVPVTLSPRLDMATVEGVAAGIQTALDGYTPERAQELSQWAKARYDVEALIDEWAEKIRS